MNRIYNKHKRDYTGGGKVRVMPNMTPEQVENDSITCNLEYGSLVIPVKHAQLVYNYMKKNKIPYSGPKNKVKSEIINAIVMPGELIIDKLHTNKIITFLKSQGINLPNT
jgi:hypothetical protein